MIHYFNADQRPGAPAGSTGHPLTDRETMSRSILTYVNQKSALRRLTEEISPRISGNCKSRASVAEARWRHWPRFPAANPIHGNRASQAGRFNRH
jgi:hypothetical protein